MAVSRGSGAIGTADRGPEHAAEGGLALADRASVGGGMRHGDHAAHRDIKADGVALAGALPGGRGRWPVARCAAIKTLVLTRRCARRRRTRPIGACARWRARSASATPASRISGARTASSRIWWTASRSPTTRRSRRKSRTWSACLGRKAVVFSVDEKSQIQALDRSQPGLPMKKGRAGTMTHDYKRHGTTTVRGAQPARGKVIGHCMKRHRHPGVHSFPQPDRPPNPALSGHSPDHRQLRHPQDAGGQTVAEKTPALPHPFHPDIGLLAQHGRALLRRGSPENASGAASSKASPKQAIYDYLAIHNHNPVPFVWTATATAILEKTARAKQTLETVRAGTKSLEVGTLADHAGTSIPDDVHVHLRNLAKGSGKAFFDPGLPKLGAIGYQDSWQLTVNIPGVSHPVPWTQVCLMRRA